MMFYDINEIAGPVHVDKYGRSSYPEPHGSWPLNDPTTITLTEEIYERWADEWLKKLKIRNGK